MFGGIVLLGTGGIFLDWKFDTTPTWTITGAVASLVFFVYECWKLITYMNKKDEDDDTTGSSL